MQYCSVVKRIEIVPGGKEDYNKLAHYHYRQSRLGVYAAIFKLKMGDGKLVVSKVEPSGIVVGVIVYTMPAPAVELRSIATGNIFAGFDRQTQLALVNKNIRCISRVIIEPRLRGLGLAGRLVRETMPKMNVAIIEAMAVMGAVNPFFKKAGMAEYKAPLPARCVQLTEALSLAGIEKNQLLDAQILEGKIRQLPTTKKGFIEQQIRAFLQSYGKRRNMAPGIERTRYILSKLTERPLYYIWLNPEIADRKEGQRGKGAKGQRK